MVGGSRRAAGTRAGGVARLSADDVAGVSGDAAGRGGRRTISGAARVFAGGAHHPQRRATDLAQSQRTPAGAADGRRTGAALARAEPDDRAARWGVSEQPPFPRGCLARIAHAADGSARRIGSDDSTGRWRAGSAGAPRQRVGGSRAAGENRRGFVRVVAPRRRRGAGRMGARGSDQTRRHHRRLIALCQSPDVTPARLRAALQGDPAA